jgi:peroxiredoxin
MKSSPVMTWISNALILISIPLFYFGFPYIAAPMCFVAIGLVVPEMMKFSSFFQFNTIVFAGLMAGMGLDYNYSSKPFLTAACGLFAFSSVARFYFMEKISYTKSAWLEPLIAVAGIGCYVNANIMQDLGWQGWTFPAPFLALSLGLSLNMLMGGKYLIDKAKTGYAAEVGKEAPDFELQDQDGQAVKLSNFKGVRDLLLIFVKGDWCPACHMMLRTYEKNREKFAAKNVMVMAIGPDPVGVNKGMVDRLGLEYKVLSDESQKIVEQYGIKIPSFTGAPKKYESTPLPASFLICKQGIVRYSSRPDMPGEFLNPSLIFPVLESLN